MMALAPRASIELTRDADGGTLDSECGLHSLKVIGRGANLLDHFGIGGHDGTKREYRLLDFSLVEQGAEVAVPLTSGQRDTPYTESASRSGSESKRASVG